MLATLRKAYKACRHSAPVVHCAVRYPIEMSGYSLPNYIMEKESSPNIPTTEGYEVEEVAPEEITIEAPDDEPGEQDTDEDEEQ